MTSSLLPLREAVSTPSSETRRIQVDDADLTAVLDALSVDCGLDIFRALSAEPTTTSDVASEVGTSIQNAAYHIEKLQDAGLVEVIDTWYSAQGTEMAVYAPTTDRIVVDIDDRN